MDTTKANNKAKIHFNIKKKTKKNNNPKTNKQKTTLKSNKVFMTQ